jgi:nucleolar protein 16
MGRTLQKKKNRSSIPRASLKPKSKKLPIKSSPLIAAHWNKHLTLSQNYRNLGLASKLNSRSGGTEVKAPKDVESKESRQGQDPLAIGASKPATATVLRTAKVIRDAEGKILEVIHEDASSNPLNDPLAPFDHASDTDTPSLPQGHSNHDRNSGVVPALEAAVTAELAEVRARKKPRKQSEREQEWIEALVVKYGDDVRGMSRDRRLNPNQQTEADIARRVGIWKKSKGNNE